MSEEDLQALTVWPDGGSVLHVAEASGIPMQLQMVSYVAKVDVLGVFHRLLRMARTWSSGHVR